MSDKPKNILLVCANYFNYQETCEFIRELFSLDDSHCLEVVVVDNSAAHLTESDWKSLSDEFAQLRIVLSESNLGYFGAAAKGLDVYLESADFPDWVIVSNTDINFPQKDFLTKLINTYDDPDSPAVVAPAIKSVISGRNQNPLMRHRPSSRRMLFLRCVLHFYPVFVVYQLLSFLKGLISKGLTTGEAATMPSSIYAAHGSFIVFNRSYFDSGGALNYPEFLFGEEVFVAETVLHQNQSVLFDPSLCVIHREHATTGIFRGRKLAAFQRDASRFIYTEYFSRRSKGY